MSVVTSLILTAGVSVKTEVIEQVNAYFEDGKGFARCDQHAGGAKAMQCSVFLAAINNLDVKGLADHLSHTDFKGSVESRPVQLFARGEDDNCFHLVLTVGQCEPPSTGKFL